MDGLDIFFFNASATHYCTGALFCCQVSQIRIATNNFRRIDLAVGSELEIPVSYCDILGKSCSLM